MRSLVQIQNSPAGGIAQLVERCLCKADVSGSSPLISTALSVEGNFYCLCTLINIGLTRRSRFSFLRPHGVRNKNERAYETELFESNELRAYGGYLGTQRR